MLILFLRGLRILLRKSRVNCLFTIGQFRLPRFLPLNSQELGINQIEEFSFIYWGMKKILFLLFCIYIRCRINVGSAILCCCDALETKSSDSVCLILYNYCQFSSVVSQSSRNRKQCFFIVHSSRYVVRSVKGKHSTKRKGVQTPSLISAKEKVSLLQKSLFDMLI